MHNELNPIVLLLWTQWHCLELIVSICRIPIVSYTGELPALSLLLIFQLGYLGVLKKILQSRESVLQWAKSKEQLLNGITNKNMIRLQSLQNKAARLVYMTPKHISTSPLIAKLHWLRIPQRIQYKILTIVFNSIHKEAPQYINELLHTYESTYHLRSSKRTSLVIPKTHKRAGDRSFSYIAPKLWNSLPPSLANKPSNSLFKKHLKSHLFQ